MPRIVTFRYPEGVRQLGLTWAVDAFTLGLSIQLWTFEIQIGLLD